MLLEPNLDDLEKERVQLWELFAQIMDIDPSVKFTAKELSKDLGFTKQELNKLLFRLYLNKAVVISGKSQNGATFYSINADFLR